MDWNTAPILRNTRADRAEAKCAELRIIIAELLAACKEISYYFHCMTDEDLRLIADMMGDPPPIGAVDAAIAKAKPSLT